MKDKEKEREQIEEARIVFEEYRKKFGEGPPLFGYSPKEAYRLLMQALDTGIPMEGAEVRAYREAGREDILI